MGLFDKVKNLFTEEIEEEIEEPIKKEVIKVEIPSPGEKKEEVKKEEKKELESTYSMNFEEDKAMSFNDTSDDFPIKSDNNFPFFDDDDFSTLDKKSKKREERKKNVYKETYKESKEVYNPIKEEKRVFKPSPIISPVYGILDKNYQKEEVKTRPVSQYNSREATVDEIRNKAYGTLEDDIETTLFGKDDGIYENDLAKDDVLKASITDETVDIKPEDKTEEVTTRTRQHRTRSLEKIDNFMKNDAKKEKSEKPRKISDEELFNMIDSMYQKGDK